MKKNLKRSNLWVVAYVALVMAVHPMFSQEESWEKLNQRVVELYDAGKYAEALPLAKRSLEVAEARFGPHDNNVAQALSILAKLQNIEGDYNAADLSMLRALTIYDANTEAELDGKRRALHVDIERSGAVTYRISEVNALLQETKGKLLLTIPPEASPLKIYIEQRLPATLEPTLSGFIEGEIVDARFVQLKAIFATLRNLSSVRFDLSVNTRPTGALFELIPPVGSHVVATTNTKITNVYRSAYEYVISKTGYKTVHGTVDFIERSGDVMDCDLQRASHSEDVHLCSLK